MDDDDDDDADDDDDNGDDDDDDDAAHAVHRLHVSCCVFLVDDETGLAVRL